MVRSVLDASALLAYLRREPGWEQVLEALTGTATMTAVNFGEVAGWLVRKGADEAAIRSLRNGLVFPLTPVDDDLCIRAALLEPLTRSKGLGIGDRLCLALAARLGSIALTADVAWQEVAAKINVEIKLIR